MPSLKVIAKAIAMTVWQQGISNVGMFISPIAKNALSTKVNFKPESKFLLDRMVTEKAVDGAIRGGLIPTKAYAKYALPKGLPEPGKRTLAIENDPHTIDNFDGRIDKGYGKGVKTLINKEMVVVKVNGNSYVGKMNYHFHEADKAGPHYDIVVEGIQPGTRQFEINIARGPAKGRYAFITTDKGSMLVTPMKDYGVIINKPNYILRHPEWLDNLPDNYIVEQKPDGSVGNCVIHNSRAYFRSHRDTTNIYHDKLPALEFLHNKSPLFIWRHLVPNPDLSGTQFQGELVHPDGVSRVSGILNAQPALARKTQELRGPVKYYVWDIVKLRGRDVTKKPYSERRKMYVEAVKDIQLINPNWFYIKEAGNIAPRSFYNSIIDLPLPYGEGVVVKDKNDPRGASFYKVKQFDLVDMEILPDGFIEGEFGVTGKYVGSLGSLVCKDIHTGKTAIVGTGFSDFERDWIWNHRDFLAGGVIKVRVFEETESSFRAPRFVEFHESKGNNEHGLLLYSEALAGMDPKDSKAAMYALKSAQGWRGK